MKVNETPSPPFWVWVMFAMLALVFVVSVGAVVVRPRPNVILGALLFSLVTSLSALFLFRSVQEEEDAGGATGPLSVLRHDLVGLSKAGQLKAARAAIEPYLEPGEKSLVIAFVLFKALPNRPGFCSLTNHRLIVVRGSSLTLRPMGLVFAEPRESIELVALKERWWSGVRIRLRCANGSVLRIIFPRFPAKWVTEGKKMVKEL